MEREHLATTALAERWEVPAKPGLHSYNLERRLPRTGGIYAVRPPRRMLRWARWLLLLLGVAGAGTYSYTVVDEKVYQAYANWAFDQQIAGHIVTFWDYLKVITGLRAAWPAEEAPAATAPLASSPARPRPANGDILGRVVIPRLHMSAVVLEGVDDATLSRSAGHVPSTALPGEAGNFSIAAHRDTLFRPLKDIRPGDEVDFATAQQNLVFRVVSTRIVKPTEVSVLQPEGDSRLLTMITCYPFYYVGSAPERFVVKAKLASTEPAAAENPAAGSTTGVRQAATASPRRAPPALHRKPKQHGRQAASAPARHSGRDGFLSAAGPVGDPDGAAGAASSSAYPAKKRGFWSRLAHVFR